MGNPHIVIPVDWWNARRSVYWGPCSSDIGAFRSV